MQLETKFSKNLRLEMDSNLYRQLSDLFGEHGRTVADAKNLGDVFHTLNTHHRDARRLHLHALKSVENGTPDGLQSNSSMATESLEKANGIL
ncbi:MAG: hypothetical protein V1658_03650, partial [Candidatus Micrarchaeota archaeon]